MFSATTSFKIDIQSLSKFIAMPNLSNIRHKTRATGAKDFYYVTKGLKSNLNRPPTAARMIATVSFLIVAY